MKAHERILQQRGHAPTAGASGAEDGVYQAIVDSGGHPQMGFTVHLKTDDVHVFLYHNLDNIDLKRSGTTGFLNFTHRGKAVTLRGTGLDGAVSAMLAHTLTALHEHDGQMPYAEGEPVIDRVLVTTLNEPPKVRD